MRNIPYFGMTTTKTLRSVFSWHASISFEKYGSNGIYFLQQELLCSSWGQFDKIFSALFINSQFQPTQKKENMSMI